MVCVEELTPTHRDPIALAPLAMASVSTLIWPPSCLWFASGNVENYAPAPAGWEQLLAGLARTRPRPLEIFRDHVRTAADHLIASEPVAECRFDVFVPRRDLRKITFITSHGTDVIRFDHRLGADPRAVDRQAVRGVRKFSPDTAALFDTLLSLKSAGPLFPADMAGVTEDPRLSGR